MSQPQPSELLDQIRNFKKCTLSCPTQFTFKPQFEGLGVFGTLVKLRGTCLDKLKELKSIPIPQGDRHPVDMSIEELEATIAYKKSLEGITEIELILNETESRISRDLSFLRKDLDKTFNIVKAYCMYPEFGEAISSIFAMPPADKCQETPNQIERRITNRGRCYYVNHSSKHNTWIHPEFLYDTYSFAKLIRLKYINSSTAGSNKSVCDFPTTSKPDNLAPRTGKCCECCDVPDVPNKPDECREPTSSW